MSARQLSAKQAAFVREYLVSLNAAGAPRQAGYSERTAAEVGYENLRKPQIRAAIENALAERAARTELTQEEVIEGLRREANFDGDGASHSARVSALSWLGRHKAMFTDKLNVSVLQRLEGMSNAELEELASLPEEALIERLGDDG